MPPKTTSGGSEQAAGVPPLSSSLDNSHTTYHTEVLQLLNAVNDIRYGRFRWLKPITERLYNDFKLSLDQLDGWRQRVNALLSRLESEGRQAEIEHATKLLVTHPEFVSDVHNPANFKVSISLGHMNFHIIGSAAMDGQFQQPPCPNPAFSVLAAQSQTAQKECQPDIGIVASQAEVQPTEQAQSSKALHGPASSRWGISGVSEESLGPGGCQEISQFSSGVPPFSSFLPKPIDLGNTTSGKRWCDGSVSLCHVVQNKLSVSLTAAGQLFVISCHICPKMIIPLPGWDEEELGIGSPRSGTRSTPTHDFIQRHFHRHLSGDLSSAVAHFKNAHGKEFRRGPRSMVRRHGAEVHDDCGSNITMDRWAIAGHNAGVDRWFDELQQHWEDLKAEYKLFRTRDTAEKLKRIAQINRSVTASCVSQIGAKTFHRAHEGKSPEEWVALCSDPTCTKPYVSDMFGEESKEHSRSHGVEVTDEFDIMLLFGFRVLRDPEADGFTSDSEISGSEQGVCANAENKKPQPKGSQKKHDLQLKRQADDIPDVSSKRSKRNPQEEASQEKTSLNNREGSAKGDKPLLDIFKPFKWTAELARITKTTKKGYLTKFSRANMLKAISERGIDGSDTEKSKADLANIIIKHDQSFSQHAHQGTESAQQGTEGTEDGTEEGTEKGTEKGTEEGIQQGMANNECQHEVEMMKDYKHEGEQDKQGTD